MANEMALDASTFLADLQKNNKEMFRETTEIMVSRNIDTLKKSAENQSAAMSSILDQINNVSEKTFQATKRGESKEASRSIKDIQKLVAQKSKSGNFSEGEQDKLNEIVNQISDTNKQLLNTENSLRNAVSSSLQDNLPSLAGILGTIGLDNPAFLFIGSMFQSLMDKRKKAKEERAKMLKQQHKDELNATLTAAEKQAQATAAAAETSQGGQEKPSQQEEESGDALEDIKENTGILDHIQGLLTSLIQNSQANQFAQIEKAREQTRANEKMQETMADVADGLEDIGSGELGDPPDGEGLFDKISGIYDSLALSFIAVKSFIAAAGTKLLTGGKMLLKTVGRFAGPIGLIVTAGFALKGAAEGWDNAAEKLGKESATATDKMSSAVGGAIGEITGVADSFLGMFGIESDIGGYLDQKTTEILAGFFDSTKAAITKVKDFFSGLFDIALPEGFSLTEMIKAPFRLIWAYWDGLFNIVFPESEMSLSKMVKKPYYLIKDFFSGLFDIALPEGFSLTEMIKVPFRLVTTFWQKIFDITFPESDFNIVNTIKNLFGKVKSVFTDFELPEFNITQTIKEFFSSIIGVFKNFSITDMLRDILPDNLATNWVLDKIGGSDDSQEEPKETKKAKEIEKTTTKPSVTDVTDVIDKNTFIPWKKGEITDWEAVNEMNRSQLAKLQEYDDFSKQTQQRLSEIAAKKQADQMKEMTRGTKQQNMKDASAAMIKEKSDKKNEKSTSINTVNAPRTSINNSSSSTSTIAPASPRDNDPTINSLTIQTRAGH